MGYDETNTKIQDEALHVSWYGIKNQTSDQVWGQVMNQMRDLVFDQVKAQVLTLVRGNLDELL